MQKSTLFLGYIFVTRIGSGRQYYCASSVSLGCIFVTRELDAEIIEAGLEISYNLCNLPKQITAANGKTIKGQIQRPYNRKGIAHPKFR